MTTFKKLPLIEFCCCIKEEYSQLTENVITMNIFFPFPTIIESMFPNNISQCIEASENSAIFY